MDYGLIIPIIISVVALSISILTFVKKRKSDQFHIALDINYKLDEIDGKLLEAATRFQHSRESETEQNVFEQKKRFLSLESLNTLEFLSFLIINNEITNKNIVKYFKPTLTKVTDQIFNDYSDIKNDDSKFKLLKTLLKRLKTCELD